MDCFVGGRRLPYVVSHSLATFLPFSRVSVHSKSVLGVFFLAGAALAAMGAAVGVD